MKKITIVGAGLAGTLCALYLARRGYAIDLFESRSDPRSSAIDYGRSINLALSCRGITGLRAMDLMDDVTKIMVPMRARAIHEADGAVHYQPFGRDYKEHINAISRTELNALLLNKTKEYPGIQVYFETKLTKMDPYNKTLEFKGPDNQLFNYSYHRLIGADGAASPIRELLHQEGLINASRTFLSHGYKELSISQRQAQGMVREHLHLWPRDSFMLLGNPNPDDSITGSLFLAQEGKNSFSELNNETRLNSFFKKEFPDAFKLMPDLVEEYFSNPTGTMSTIKCAPWNYSDDCLLIGDAAHGVIPFFGQGMNCAFEDCRILDELLDLNKDDWSKVMPLFYKERKMNTDAIAHMSMDNYHEIHSDIRDPQFIMRKEVERELMTHYPERYISKHVLVMFTNTPYAKALAIGALQNTLLSQICSSIKGIKELDWEHVDKKMFEYDKKMAELF